MTDESGKTISDADRRLLRKMLGEGGRNISDADRAKVDKILGVKKKSEATPKLKKGGTAKRQIGGTTQGYDARLDERLGMTGRPRSATGQTYAQRRAESRGARTPVGSFGFTAKKGGTAKRKKGGTVKRARGGAAKKK